MPNFNITNVLTVLLVYIDLFKSGRQHKTDNWEELICPLPFYIALFHFKHSYSS